MSSSATSPFAPSERMLRQFAGLWIIFFGAIAAQQEFIRDRHGLAIILAVLAVTIGPLGLALPRAIRPIYIGWMALAFPIGWTVSRLILSLLYYGMFTPVALFFRATRRDTLCLKRPPSDTITHWQPKPRPSDPAQYLKQF
jgi:hypothetical protein